MLSYSNASQSLHSQAICKYFPKSSDYYEIRFSAIWLVFFRRTMMTDPGAVPRGNATKENIQQMGFKEGQVIFKCPKCCSIKPERWDIQKQKYMDIKDYVCFSFSELIIVPSVRDVSARWTIIVRNYYTSVAKFSKLIHYHFLSQVHGSIIVSSKMGIFQMIQFKLFKSFSYFF